MSTIVGHGFRLFCDRDGTIVRTLSKSIANVKTAYDRRTVQVDYPAGNPVRFLKERRWRENMSADRSMSPLGNAICVFWS